jgi:DNA replicative helicase MCM subunit Mcm2 (Cdc46/Mcm family)
VSDPRDEASYVCQACGEEIVVPVDPSEGEDQDLVEDCPVCCRPMRLRVTVEPDGSVRIDATAD